MKKILLFVLVCFIGVLFTFVVVNAGNNPETSELNYIGHSGNSFTYLAVNDPPPSISHIELNLDECYFPQVTESNYPIVIDQNFRRFKWDTGFEDDELERTLTFTVLHYGELRPVEYTIKSGQEYTYGTVLFPVKACPDPTDTPTSTPTNTNTPTSTSTATQTTTPTSTNTSTSTSTPTQTVTNTVTPTVVTSTSTPTNTPTWTPTTVITVTPRIEKTPTNTPVPTLTLTPDDPSCDSSFDPAYTKPNFEHGISANGYVGTIYFHQADYREGIVYPLGVIGTWHTSESTDGGWDYPYKGVFTTNPGCNWDAWITVRFYNEQTGQLCKLPIVDGAVDGNPELGAIKRGSEYAIEVSMEPYDCN